jgi:putative FmdB family regulatory protein
MPIYEYVCRACGHELEKLQKFSEAPLRDCPECGAAELTKKVSAAGFRLKGGGWYVTDFRDGGNKTKANKEGSKSESDKKDESGKSDSKKSASEGTKTDSVKGKKEGNKQDNKKRASAGDA